MPRNVLYTKRKNVKIFLPNCSTLGFGKYYASPGDLINYKEEYVGGTHGYRLARVIGRIKGTDNCGSQCKGHILVSALEDELTYAYERWIDPKDVFRCVDSKKSAEFISWFLSATPEQLQEYNRR